MRPVVEHKRHVEDQETWVEAGQERCVDHGKIESAELQALDHVALVAELLVREHLNLNAAAALAGDLVGHALGAFVVEIFGRSERPHFQNDLALCEP